MKKVITFLIAVFIGIALSAQTSNTFKYVVNANGGINAALGATANVVSIADYTIDKVGSTYYARPGIGTGYTAYSNADATIVIQAALDALTTGGKVYIKQGLYDNLNAIEVNNANIIIEGEGKFTTILKLKNGFDTGKTFASYPKFIAIAANGITIRNLQLDGNAAGQTYQWAPGNVTGRIHGIYTGYSVVNGWVTPYDFLLENSYIHDFTEFGFWAAQLDRGEIRNCYFKDNQENNINGSVGATNLVIHHSVFSGSASVSVAISGTNNEVSDCQIRDGNIAGGGTCWGGEFMAPIRSKFIDNVITGFNEGIVSGNAGHDNNIEYNIISNVLTNAITMTGDSSSTIKSNNINGFGNNGITLVGCEEMDISGNTVSNLTGSGTAALNLTNTGGTYSINNIIKNNILINLHGYGINIAASCNNNIVTDNYIDGTAWGDVNNASTGTIWKGNYGKKTGSWLSETGASNITATATADGLTTGIIKPGSQNLTVASNINAAYWISLPAASAATIGTRITGLLVGAQVCELRTQAAQEGTVYINGITGAGKEAALPAACSFEVIQVSATHWILKAWTALGAEITAIVPD